jgi:mRNA-degrading endonuclease toxin of MazEF toxin-antitoxin module
VVVSLDSRNQSERASSVLVVPFGSYGRPGPTVTEFPPGESGLPGVSYLKAHFIQVLEKTALLERQPRRLSSARMKTLVEMIRRAVDPDAPWAE